MGMADEAGRREALGAETAVQTLCRGRHRIICPAPQYLVGRRVYMARKQEIIN